MNIVGKILVVLVLLLAFVVGGFQVIDFATRTNWKTAHETRVAELRAAYTSLETWQETARQLDREIKKIRAAKETTESSTIRDSSEHKAEILLLNEKIAKLEEARQRAELAMKEAQVNLDRAVTLNADRKKTIDERDAKILALFKDNDDFKNKWLAEQARADNIDTRNLELLERNRQLEQLLAQKEALGGTTVASKDPNAPNPPQRFVKGKIQKVDAEGRILIDVGLDDGVKEGHTLEVYRLQPRPEYLGMLRILDAHNRESIARLVGRGKMLVQGDQVASTIDTRR